MRCACIDIGSNTTRLLVAESRGDELVQIGGERRFTRLILGRAADGSIPDEKVAEVAAVVAGQALAAHALGAARVIAVATSAVRCAPNRVALTEAVRAASGLDVVVLEPGEEARLAFDGATRALPAAARGEPCDAVAVVDVGGGSTELAVGRPGHELDWWSSAELGSGNLSERHLRSDPPSRSQLAALREDACASLARVRPPPAGRALAVGGSATSLHRLCGGDLGTGSLDAALERLAAGPAREVARRFGLEPQRVLLLPAGLELLRAASEVLGCELECGSGGLREGVVLAEIARFASA